METKTSQRKVRAGVVVSKSTDKTIVVKVTRTAKHPLYRKLMKINKKYYVHDEKNEARKGDQVNIIECRPISKTKRWRLQSINNSQQS